MACIFWRLAQRVLDARALGRLGPQAGVRVRQLLQVQLLAGEVGQNAAEQQRVLGMQRTDREVDRHGAAVRPAEGQFRPTGCMPRLQQHRPQPRHVGRQDEAGQLLAYHRLRRHPQHSGEPAIRVVDPPILAERHGTFLHLLDEEAIGPVRRLERVDPVRTGKVTDDQGIHLAAADRLQRLPGFGQLGLELAPACIRLGRCRLFLDGAHGQSGTMSSPRSTRSSSERSPMMRRIGSGRIFTSVGAAIT